MTVKTERRDFITGIGAAAASTTLLAGTQALAQANQQTGTKPMAYQPKPMPFDPKTINGISEKVLVSHYENNYVGAVKRLNAICTQLAELEDTGERSGRRHGVDSARSVGEPRVGGRLRAKACPGDDRRC